MKKIIMLVLLSAMLVFATGCNKQQETTGVTGSQFVGGSQGLTIQFAEGTPPEKVLDQNQPFGVSIRLTNVGDHDIETLSDATVTISGIDPADFGVSEGDMKQDVPEELRGAQKDSEGNPVSGTDLVLDFPASGAALQHQKEIAGSVTYNVRADVCYRYGSVSNTKLCILEDILGTSGRESSLCTIAEDKPLDNSGAPVQVDAFRESVSSSTKVAFVFKVKHLGSGSVHDPGSECDSAFTAKDKVRVKVDTGLADGLTCSGLQDSAGSGSTFEGTATLLNGEREIRCTQTVNSPTDIEKLLRIDLDYDYKQHATKSLVVQHIGG